MFMIWKEINPEAGKVLYILDLQQRDHFPSGIRAAQLGYANNVAYEDGVVHSVSNLFPARLSTMIQLDQTGYRLSVHFYDEQEAKSKIERRVKVLLGGGGDYPPREEDPSLIAKWLREIHEFQTLLERHEYVTFPSCQRILPKGKPAESDPHRPLESSERILLLPYVDALFTSMEKIDLKKPLREVGYYKGLIKRLLER